MPIWLPIPYHAGCKSSRQESTGPFSRNMVNGQGIRHRLWFMRCSIGQRRFAGPLDQPGDVVEGDAAAEECLDRDLIGGIEHGGRAAAGPQRIERHPQGRKTGEIRPFEGQLPDAREIEPAGARRQPPRIGKTMRDRHPHIRRGQACSDGAVAECDQPMHHRLGMDENVEPLRALCQKYNALQ